MKNDYSIGLAEAFQNLLHRNWAEKSWPRTSRTRRAIRTSVRRSLPYGAQAAQAHIRARLLFRGRLDRAYRRSLGLEGAAARAVTVGIHRTCSRSAATPSTGRISPTTSHPTSQPRRPRQFVANFTTKYGQAPTGLGALGYEAAAGLDRRRSRRAGKTDPDRDSRCHRDAPKISKACHGQNHASTLSATRTEERRGAQGRRRQGQVRSIHRPVIGKRSE